MQHSDYSAIGKVMDVLENGTHARRIVWAMVAAGWLYVLTLFITAIRWW